MELSIEAKSLCVFATLMLGRFCVSSQDTTKVLTTRAGQFKGSLRELNVFGETKTVEKYLGVPYAEPPKRFQRPVVKAPMAMDDVYDATDYKPSCSQLGIPLNGVRKPGLSVEVSESCLYLNIYKPSDRGTENGLAVMVWFHGGGFVCGSPQFYSGDMLSAYGDVIFISVSYRLAVFGFLSTGDKHLPGNRGLWDQHTALLWIHDYIADFGGDPDNVAIIGHSAGSASVVYQSLFPRNKGLFRRVIGISGSPTGPWSLQPNPLEITRRFASLLGCSSKDTTKEMVQCIESKSTDEIEAVLNNPENGYIKFPMDLVPVVDEEFLGSNPYNIISHETVLSAESKEMFASLDFMTGITSGEGAMNIHPFVGVFNTFDFALSREEFEQMSVPEAARILFGDNVPDVVVDMIIHKYTNWTNPEDIDNIRQSFLDMTGDYVFNFHAKLVADMHANLSSPNGGKTFTYYFEAFPSQHILEVPTWVSKPNHGDELTFLYGHDKEGYTAWTHPYSEGYEPADWELKTSKLFMTLITNFAKTG